jgi:GT2 family glycosyltransferase
VSNQKLRVSVVIPNLNGKGFLGECLRALERQTYRDFEVVLVDNGSTDGSLAYVRNEFPWLRTIVENASNLGFAKACNQGIEASSGTYIALLNNDTEAHVSWLAELVAAADEHSAVGMFARKTLFFDRRDTIDTAGHLFYPDGLNRGRGRLEVDTGQFDDKTDVFFPSGCAALYRKEMLDEIGTFDEHHFAYGDDTDIGIRGRLAGWGCLFVPGSVVYHRYSMTTGAYSPRKAYLVERNRIWIVWKYFPMRHLLVSPFYSFARYCFQAYGAVSGKGAAGQFAKQHSGWSLIGSVVKAYIDAFMDAPRVWSERRRLKGLRKVSDAEIDRWFTDYRMSVREIALKD